DKLNSAASSTALAGTEFTDLPDGLPDIVTQEALAQTADYTTKYEKAVALQNWFRDNFDYSLQTVSGNGTDALEAFLTEGKGGRTGYCEQFASAMAVMARTLNIPARVAVGFLSPELQSKDPDGRSTYVYSAWD